ncbi:MAG TPA: alpha/beta hydrolase [Rhodopila sp.]|nr:alpha/beta hydrolase [Rhodopila sp.]
MADPEIDIIRDILHSQPRPAELQERRQRLDALGARYKVAPDAKVQAVDANGVAAEWTTVPGADPTRVIMFLHGGGYISGSIASHRHMIAEAGRQAGARTFAVGYRLAPEHPFPAALDDALTAYKFLLASGYAPGQIGLAGESAGGGLALATAISLRDAGLPLPACLWCSSPWVDLEMSGATMTTKAAVDPLVQKSYLQELAASYLAGTDPRTPLVSPIRADLRGLPPMLVQVGSAETLLDDSIRLAGIAGAANVRITLEVWPDMIHAWHLFYQQVAAGRRALAAVGAFFRSTLT